MKYLGKMITVPTLSPFSIVTFNLNVLNHLTKKNDGQN